MTQALPPFDSLLMTIVLATLAIGLPILVVLAIRFLWDRSLYLGRSKELEKLIWQLHRIATAMEHQMNLSFPAVQPGTEEPGDLAYLERPAAQAKPASQDAAQSVAATSGTAPASTDKEPAEQQPTTSDPSAEPPRHAGVNSMFGL